MKHQLSFAVTLRRSFDSAALNGARFFCGNAALQPVEKPDGLYVFTDIPVCKIRAEIAGMQPAHIEPEAGQCTPVCMYEGGGFSPPNGYRIAEYRANAQERLSVAPHTDMLKVIESGNGWVRLALRRGAPTGGWLLFKRADGREEAAFIVEKQAPDKYYLLGCGDLEGASASRIYTGKADENGVCRIVLPADVPNTAPRPLDGLALHHASALQ